MSKKQAIIIGAGPAGLTLALELLRRTDIQPVILEQSESMGGISRTVRYKGNRMDIGGHRFFSKSDRVMKWWLEMLPLQAMPVANQTNGTPRSAEINYQRQRRLIDWSAHSPDPETTDRVMLLRSRLKQIFLADKSIAQRETETSLIERFLYPKFGPGQMWEETARRITAAGGEIHFHRRVTKIVSEAKRITAIELTDDRTGKMETCRGD